MKLETKFFGTQEVDEKEFISFNHGIPGFENERRYYITQYGPESPFMVMQSVEKPNLAFILIRLGDVMPGYTIDLGEEVTVELKLVKPEEAMVYAIVSIPGELAGATVNLAAPLVINIKAKLGKQIILNNPAYGLRHPLFAENPAGKAESKPASAAK
jgi:flagellar assembly factor FliW